ncbi:hypothetical protein BIW11_07259 [Tropilaelaps mercedesae]|uniref:Phospholipase A2 n=1 Tax=Tropilaelaps mercedesae TaxID=418985 RepID=A0A1V9XUP8_9ACAR|nr:hypothetical protein BIW11_07259 [Tropilaelaps mercedesae]
MATYLVRSAGPWRNRHLGSSLTAGSHRLYRLTAMAFLLAVIVTAAQEAFQSEETSHWSVDIPGFYHRLYFSGGESEVRAHLRQVTVLENALQARGTVSRRLSDGHQILSLFYLDSKLASCRVESDPVEVAEFYRTMMDDFNCAEHRTARKRFDKLRRGDQPSRPIMSSSSSEDVDLTNLDVETLGSKDAEGRSQTTMYVSKETLGTHNDVRGGTGRLTIVEESNRASSFGESQSVEDRLSSSSEEPPWCSIDDRLERQIWNETFILLDQASEHDELMAEVTQVLHFRLHRRACRKLQRRLRIAAAVHDKTQAVDKEKVRTIRQSDDDEAVSVEELTDVENRKTGNVIRQRRKRMRRSLFSSIMPGTKWCGSGNHATAINELGASASTDNCCREHDQCPNTLAAFERRWGLRNKSLFTMSHCKCDERFRSCLKMARTSQSRFVGRLFFDLLSKQCFVFKKVRRCARLSWDGSRCIRKRWAKKAVARNGMSYY